MNVTELGWYFVSCPRFGSVPGQTFWYGTPSKSLSVPIQPVIGALVAYVKGGGAQRLAVERFDSEPVSESEIMPLLLEAGFLAGPRRAVLRP